MCHAYLRHFHKLSAYKNSNHVIFIHNFQFHMHTKWCDSSQHKTNFIFIFEIASPWFRFGWWNIWIGFHWIWMKHSTRIRYFIYGKYTIVNVYSVTTQMESLNGTRTNQNLSTFECLKIFVELFFFILGTNRRSMSCKKLNIFPDFESKYYFRNMFKVHIIVHVTFFTD